MANKFKIKRSSVPGRIPTASDLDVGELAINLVDQRLFSKDGSNTVIDVVGQNVNTTANVTFRSANITGNATIGSLVANGSVGTSGQILTSNGSSFYWQTPTNFANGQSIQVANLVITGSITANGSTGLPGRVLTTNGSAVYWSAATGGTSTGTDTLDINAVAESNSDLAYTFSHVLDENKSLITFNGLVQERDTYSISGNTVTFVDSIPSNTSIGVVQFDSAYYNLQYEVVNLPSATNTFNISTESDTYRTLMFVNGLTQRPSLDFTISGNTANFANTLPASASVISIVLSNPHSYSTILGDGSNTYVIPNTVTFDNSYVTINGLIQRPTIDYTMDGEGHISFADGLLVGAYATVQVFDQTQVIISGFTFINSNSTLRIAMSNGTTYYASIPTANSTQSGLVKVMDSVSNTDNLNAASANSVKRAYDLAVTANAGLATAYSNAVAYAASNTYVNNTFAPKISPTFTGTLNANDVVVTGNLTIIGNTTYINTTVLNVGDNIITINGDHTGTPTENAGIEVNRGTSANVAIRWNETTDQWEFTNDGSTYAAFGGALEAAAAYTNAVSYASTIAGTAYSNAISTAATDATNKASNAYSNAVSYADAKAANAYSNAASYADTKAATAYSNAVSTAATDAANKAANAYSNAVSTAATDATNKAANAYSNAVSTAATDAANKAANAYSNAVSYTDAKAANAYSNAISYADTAASTAYSNAVSTAATDATNKAANAYSNAVSYADAKAANAYSNAVSYADNKAANAYSNATSYADTAAATAYTNAVGYAASNSYVNTTFAPITNPTFTGNVSANNLSLTGRLSVEGNTTVNNAFAAGNTTITGFANISGNTSVGGSLTISGNLTVSGTTSYINTTELNIGDNIITLNADLGAVTPTENAGVQINRGTSANVQLRWNETSDKWEFTNDGTTYLAVASNNDTAAAYSNATSYADTAAATSYSNAISTAAIDATNKASNAYSNAVSYADTKAATAYTNAVAYAASNTYVNTTFAPLAGATFTGPVSGITTLAAGNTTITGFANISSTANIGGAVTARSTLTVNGAVTIANTLATGNTTVTGFANVTSSIQGGSSLTIAGALSGVTTAGMGNTTITGFANVSSTLQVTGNATFSNTISVTGAATFSNTVSFAGNITGSAANVTIVAGAYTTTFANNGTTTFPGAVIGITTLAAGNTTITGFANLSSTLAAGNTTITGFANISSALAAGNTTLNGFANIAGTLQVTGNTTLANTVINGDFTVTGTTTYINTTNISTGDNIITLNADITGAPSENAGIEINRGTSANVSLIWNETNDRWQFTNNGSTYVTLASNNDVDTAYSNATSYADTKAATAYSNAVSTAAADATTKANAAYSNAANYADAKAANTYSNAVAYAASNTYVNSTFAKLSGDTFTGDVIISGNLIVSGTTTYVNTNIFQIADNIVTLNADHVGSPTANVGFEVNRGTSANVGLLWNESTDRWTFTNDGSTYYNIPLTAGANGFSQFRVTGQANVDATAITDTIRFVAGNNIVLTTNSASKSITIEAALATTNGTIVDFNTVIAANNDLTYYVSNTVSDDNALVAVNGIMQYGFYTLSGNSVTFNSAVDDPNGSISIVRLDNSIGAPFLSLETATYDGNTAYVFTSTLKASSTLLFVNGILQRNFVDYSVSGSTLTFSNDEQLPSVGASIVLYTTRSSFKRNIATAILGTTSYTLPNDPTDGKTIIFINGVLQRPTIDYTFAGSDVIFAYQPPPEAGLTALHLEVADGGIDKQSITATGANSYGLDISTTVDDILVYVAGIYQHPVEDYTIGGGTTLRFDEGVPSGLPIRIRYINT